MIQGQRQRESHNEDKVKGVISSGVLFLVPSLRNRHSQVSQCTVISKFTECIKEMQ